jgi:hypothetical protein
MTGIVLVLVTAGLIAVYLIAEYVKYRSGAPS